MSLHKNLTASALVFCCLVAGAKDKKKNLLPADILRARTVLVMVDPHAGLETEDPNANRDARRDVESAIVKWGRFNPVQDVYTADLIIVVRRGQDQLAQGTMGGTRVNSNPPVMVQRNDTGITGAGHTGPSGIPGDASSSGQYPSSPRPYPQTEIGSSQDSFVVYRGAPTGGATPANNPLDMPPVWRYNAKDALTWPDVQAVDAFRKLVAESEKQLANKP